MISGLAFWNARGVFGIREFEIYADDNDDISDGLGQLLGGRRTATMFEDTATTTTADIFRFNAVETRYVHLNIRSNHGSFFSVGAGEIVFQEVPFEFSNLPAMVFLVAVGGLGYSRATNKQ